MVVRVKEGRENIKNKHTVPGYNNGRITVVMLYQIRGQNGKCDPNNDIPACDYYVFHVRLPLIYADQKWLCAIIKFVIKPLKYK